MICLHRSTQIAKRKNPKLVNRSLHLFFFFYWLDNQRKIVYYLFSTFKCIEIRKQMDCCVSEQFPNGCKKKLFCSLWRGKDQLVRRNNKLFFFLCVSQNNKQIKTWCCIKLRNAKMISLIYIVRHLHSLFNDELIPVVVVVVLVCSI